MRTRSGIAECLLLALALAGCRTEVSQPPVQSRVVTQRDAAPSPPPGSSTNYFVQVIPDQVHIVGYGLPLTAAVSDLQPNRVWTLLEGGADPNVREEDGTSWPPLALAMKGRAMTHETYEDEYNARRDIMALLLAHGADANIRWCDTDRPRCNERTGVTPLMYAATLGYDDFTEILLKHGADESLRDWRGLTAADYRGVKLTRPSSWCLAPILKESPEPFAPRPILEDARWLVDPEYLEQARIGGLTDMLEALGSNTDRSVEIVKDQGICEAAAVAYARYRVMEQSEPAPRPVVPVAVVRAGPVWIVDDQADGGGRGIFNKSWRILAFFEPPD